MRKQIMGTLCLIELLASMAFASTTADKLECFRQLEKNVRTHFNNQSGYFPLGFDGPIVSFVAPDTTTVSKLVFFLKKNSVEVLTLPTYGKVSNDIDINIAPPITDIYYNQKHYYIQHDTFGNIVAYDDNKKPIANSATFNQAKYDACKKAISDTIESRQPNEDESKWINKKLDYFLKDEIKNYFGFFQQEYKSGQESKPPIERSNEYKAILKSTSCSKISEIQNEIAYLNLELTLEVVLKPKDLSSMQRIIDRHFKNDLTITDEKINEIKMFERSLLTPQSSSTAQ